MQTLNSKLFNLEDNKLRLHTDIRNKLIEIANAFLEDLREQNINIYPADIRLVGSNAGFDFTAYSDIDLHLVVDFEMYSQDALLLQTALNISRLKFTQRISKALQFLMEYILLFKIGGLNFQNLKQICLSILLLKLRIRLLSGSVLYKLY